MSQWYRFTNKIIVHWFIVWYLSADVSLLSIILIQKSLHMWDGRSSHSLSQSSFNLEGLSTHFIRYNWHGEKRYKEQCWALTSPQTFSPLLEMRMLWALTILGVQVHDKTQYSLYFRSLEPVQERAEIESPLKIYCSMIALLLIALFSAGQMDFQTNRQT